MATMNLLFQINWQHPWAFALVSLPLAIYILSILLQLKAMKSYADLALLPWVVPVKKRWNSHRIKAIAYFLAWLCLVTVLAGPRIPVVNENDGDINIIVMIDTSRSMRANDVFPSRLQRAKLELYELLQSAKPARFSLVVFAARSHLYVPLTSDRNLLRYYTARLDSLILPTRGSELENAIEYADANLNSTSRPTAYVLISDGEFHNQVTIKPSTPPIFVLGIGSASGSGIPLEEGNWLEVNSRQVITRLNENALRHIATQSQGAYRRASDDNSDWKYLLGEMEKGFAKIPHNQKSHDEWKYLYRLPLLLAIVLLFFSSIPVRRNTISALFLITSFGLSGFSGEANAISIEENAAYKALTEKNYQSALQQYQQIGGYKGHFGSGVAYYLSNKMYKAQREFQLAVLAANNDELRAKAIYNLANTQFRLGDYEMAIQLYQNTLLYKPNYASAKNNLKLAQTIWALILKNIEQIELNTQATPGAGPRERVANLDELQDLNATLSIANEDKMKYKLPSLPSIQQLVRQGIDKFQIAANGKNENKESHRRHKIDATRLAIKRLKIDDPLLWKSLFEIEEGFPAPQSNPVEIPGENPW